MNESAKVYTKRKENGQYGLFARVLFRSGQTVLDIRSGDKEEEPNFRSIELDDGHYMHPDGMFTNHSCDPSTFVDKEGGLLIATRQIWPNEEITFDYKETETNLAASFNCDCGSKNCKGWIL